MSQLKGNSHAKDRRNTNDKKKIEKVLQWLMWCTNACIWENVGQRGRAGI